MPPLAGRRRRRSTATRVPTTTSRSPTDFDSTLAAHAGADQPDRGRRRLALRRRHDGLPRRRRRTSTTAGLQLLDDRGRARPRRRPTWPGRRPRPALVSDELHRAADRPPDDRARPRRRGDPGRADPVREGGRPAELVPRRRRVHLRPDAPPRATAPTTWSRSSREGTGGRTGYCEQFAVGDGGDGPDRSASRPGSRSASCSPTRSGRTPGSTARTTCTPGPSSTSPAPAGCASSRPRPVAAPTCPATPRSDVPGRRPDPAVRPAAGQRRAPEPRRQPTAPAPSDVRRRPRRRRRPGPASRGCRSLGGLVVVALLGGLAAAAPRACGAGGASAGWPAGPRTAWAELRDTARRPRRALAARAARRARPATRWSRYFGAPVDEPRPPSARARRRTSPPRPCARWTGSSATLELARYAARPRRGPDRRCAPTPRPASPR